MAAREPSGVLRQRRGGSSRYLSAIEKVYGAENRGQPPYDPRMMTKLLVYAYCVGVFSSRRIQRRLVEDIAFKVLAAGNEPNFRTISDFRKIHLEALEGLFEQVLKIALEAGAMKLGRVALDGTKMKANASKHKAMSYDRMKDKEQQLRDEVFEAVTGTGRDRRCCRGCTVRGQASARRRTARRTAATREPTEEDQRSQTGGRIARAQIKGEKDGRRGERPEETAQRQRSVYNFTDPESRMMKGREDPVQGFDAQAAVEPELQLIVGQSVTQATNDNSKSN